MWWQSRGYSRLSSQGSIAVVQHESQDYPYLTPVIKEVESERTEREDLESMIIKKRKATPKDPNKH